MRTLDSNVATFDRSRASFDRSRPTRRLRTAIRILRAFTLIEMLIAVGAVALIAVGLSKLFASTGETIKIGRRISSLNEAASTLERQIRKDITAIAGSGEGFIVVRHKLLKAPAGLSPGTRNGILLSADDRNADPRPRRVDEIVFFATGAFTSSREPQHAGRIPAGSAARIYYGHGQRLENYENLTIYSDPLWKNNPVVWPPLALGGGLGETGPNRYAGSWTLLRHTTVLARPQKTAAFPSGAALANPLTPPMWPDSVTQVSLQPTLASIFRFDPLVPGSGGADVLGNGYKFAAVNPTGGITINKSTLKLPPQNSWARPNETRDWPSCLSGMVDIASTDLNMIKARVIGAGADPDKPGSPNLLQDDTFVGLGIPVRTQAMNGTAANLIAAGTAAYRDINPLHAQKMYMASAMPSNDQWLFTVSNCATPQQPTAGNNPTAYHEQRMIYAAETPDFTGNLNPNHTGTRYSDASEPYHRQDQAMLSSSIITLGCTEFKVEWSFGDVERNAAGQASIIWHGLDRPYRAIPANNTNGLQPDVVYNDHTAPASPALIHWPIPDLTNLTAQFPATDDIPLYSFFGYLDPTSSPSNFSDWPWPRLLRITYTLTDPADPSVEQTYQFVVQVPAQQRRSS